MKNASTKFRNSIENGKPIYAYANFVLEDGTELEMTSHKDFCIEGNSYSEGGTDGFPLGEALCKSINISIDNHDERYSSYDFYKSKITLYSEIDIDDGTTERILEGFFTVIDSVTPGDIIEFTAYDDMYKTNIDFNSDLTYPTTLYLLLNEVCRKCGIVLGSQFFTHRNFSVNVAPENCTARDIIGYVAQVAGGNAMISPETKTLVIKSYNLEDYKKIQIINARNYKKTVNNLISGGTFTDAITDTVIGDELTYSNSYHLLHSFTENPEIGTDDVTISGVLCEIEEDEGGGTKKYLYGTEDYALKIENPLIRGDENSAVKLIGDMIIGLTIRPFSGSFSPNPLMEFMDTVLIVDRKYNIYQSILTSHTYNYLGTSDVENSTQSPERNAMTYSNSASSVYRKLQEDVKRDKSAWENAVENLNDRLQAAGGLYLTQQEQSDDSIIYFFHDKPTLDESQIVMKISNIGIAISNDGGKNYLTAITVDGIAILEQIYSIGINADHITTGTMTANRINGGTLALGGEENKRGRIEVYDYNNTLKGVWDNNGFQVYDFTGTSQLVIRDGGTTFPGSSIPSLNFIVKKDGGVASYEMGAFGLQEENGNYGIITDIMPSNSGNFISWGQGNYKYFWYSAVEGYDVRTETAVKARTLNAGADLDMHNYTLRNSRIEESFTISNNTDTNFYSNINMHNFTLSNLRLDNIVGVGYEDKAPLTGTVDFVKDIQTNDEGIVTSWEKGTLTFENGILVGW